MRFKFLTTTLTTSLAVVAFALSGASAEAAIVSPNEISGLQLWLDGNDVDGNGVAGGSFVSDAWINKGAATNSNVVQATAGSRPTIFANSMNGLSTVRFDGNDAMFFSGSASILDLPETSSSTLFIVQRSTQATQVDNRLLTLQAGNSTRYGMYWVNSQPSYIGGNATAFSSLTSSQPLLTLTDTHILAGRLEVGVSKTLHVDGTQVANNTSTALAQTDSLTWGQIGAYSSDGMAIANGFQGDIAEMLLFNRALTPAEMADVQGYLTAKWVTPVPEPSTWAMIAAIGGAFCFRQRRKLLQQN